MMKAVIFDMYETLITHYHCPLYFSAEMAADAVQAVWYLRDGTAQPAGRMADFVQAERPLDVVALVEK